MSWFAAAVVAGLVLLALNGHGLAGFWAGGGIAVTGTFLHGTYLWQRRAARHMPETFKVRRPEGLVPAHRRKLDLWVLVQWLAIGLCGGAGALGLDALSWEPFDRVGLVLTVLVVAWVVLWSTVYVSSMFDWYLVMPKVSGVSCPAPCERPGKQRWAGITGLWSFHRGVARLIVPAAVIGAPTVIGALTDSNAGQAISFSIAAALAVYLLDFEAQGKAALNYGLNARRYVGDRLWLVRERDDAVTREAAYLVDVAAEGAKFKYLDDQGEYRGIAFDSKHDDEGSPIALTALNDRRPVKGALAPCHSYCTGVNWYCYRNPLAHSQHSTAPETSEPATAEDPPTQSPGRGSRTERKSG